MSRCWQHHLHGFPVTVQWVIWPRWAGAGKHRWVKTVIRGTEIPHRHKATNSCWVNGSAVLALGILSIHLVFMELSHDDRLACPLLFNHGWCYYNSHLTGVSEALEWQLNGVVMIVIFFEWIIRVKCSKVWHALYSQSFWKFKYEIRLQF